MKAVGVAVFVGALAIAGVAQAQMMAGGPMGPYVSRNLAALKGQQPTGGPFNVALKGEYQALGEEALAESDHQHADIYIRKGWVAGAGGATLPENPRTWILPKRERGMIYQWHPQLLQALDANRAAKPAAAARAQAMFDCWVEEAHEDYWMRDLSAGTRMTDNHYQPQDIAKCKNAFFCAMWEMGFQVPIQCVVPSQNINFEFDRPRSLRTASRADLWRGGPEAGTGGNAPRGAAQLDALIASMRAASASSVLLKGHTDTVGSAGYNQQLSEWRALFISQELQKAGVAQTRIQFRGVGKAELAVPTRDQQRRVENRRVSYQLGR